MSLLRECIKLYLDNYSSVTKKVKDHILKTLETRHNVRSIGFNVNTFGLTQVNVLSVVERLREENLTVEIKIIAGNVSGFVVSGWAK